MLFDGAVEFTPKNNFVLIKPDPGNERYTLQSGQEIFIDLSYEPERHATVSGRVVAVPDRLITESRPGHGMEWETEMELQVGDQVWYHYLSGMNAIGKDDPKYFESENELFIMVKYDRIFAARRRVTLEQWWSKAKESNVQFAEIDQSGVPLDSVSVDFLLEDEAGQTPPMYYLTMPLNGFILVDKVDDPDLKVLFPSNVKKPGHFARVRYIGTPIKRYLQGERFYGPDTNEIQVGDLVWYGQNADIPLEYSFHNKLEKEPLTRIQRRFVQAVVKTK